MKKLVECVLVEGTDKQTFVDSFDETNAEWWNMLEGFDNLIVMKVEESYLETFTSDPRIESAEVQRKVFPASLPSEISVNKEVTATYSGLYGNNGEDYMPLQFYLANDQIRSSNGQPVGNNSNDYWAKIPNATYKSRWTGQHIDFVSIEVPPIESGMIGYHDNHPDFDDLDNPGTSRVIPMNWPGLDSPENNQVSSNNVLSAHAAGTLSAAGGSNCGFAKRSKLRVAYITDDEDSVVEILNSIYNWTNSKSVNPATGSRNPTIIIFEYQHLINNVIGIRPDQISQIYIDNLKNGGAGETINEPSGGWGNDLTPFTNANMIPKRIFDPVSESYDWYITMPWQAQASAIQSAIKQVSTSDSNQPLLTPIISVVATGNDCGVFVKNGAEGYHTHVVLKDANSTVKGIYPSDSGSTTVITVSASGYDFYGSGKYYPFRHYGPEGSPAAIDVAAGQNSEAKPTLDSYTVRGPGIDAVGYGAMTWTAYPRSQYGTYRWGMFSGTSCATPTVAGIVACEMEKYQYYHRNLPQGFQYPGTGKIKQILDSNAKDVLIDVPSTTWNSVPSASSFLSSGDLTGYEDLVKLHPNNSLNGQTTAGELSGTTTKRVFFNAQGFDRKNTQGRRPTSGAVYPRPRIKRNSSS